MKQNLFVQSDIWNYCFKYTSDLSYNLKKLEYLTYKYINGSHMIIDKTVVKLLQFYIFTNKAKICVDIGTFTGMSAVAMAELSKDILVYTIDKYYQSGRYLAKEFISKYKNIKYYQGDAIDILPILPNKIDLVFIDADKRRVKNYFDILFLKLNNNGLIIVDDVLWRGEVLNPNDKRSQVLDSFNKYIKYRHDLEVLILPIRHGISIIRKI